MDEIDRILDEIEEKVEEFRRELLEEARRYLESQASLLFKTEGKSLRVDWKPVKEAYLKWKIKKGFSEKTLHKTTTLAQSFHGEVKKEEIVFGTPVKYVAFHEEGTSKMPARPIFKPLVEDLSENIPELVSLISKELFGV
jgi:phage gpG-like protein